MFLFRRRETRRCLFAFERTHNKRETFIFSSSTKQSVFCQSFALGLIRSCVGNSSGTTRKNVRQDRRESRRMKQEKRKCSWEANKSKLFSIAKRKDALRLDISGFSSLFFCVVSSLFLANSFHGAKAKGSFSEKEERLSWKWKRKESVSHWFGFARLLSLVTLM